MPFTKTEESHKRKKKKIKILINDTLLMEFAGDRKDWAMLNNVKC